MRSPDPWATEKMSRSDAQRRYSNLIQYQIRPMLMDRRMSDENRVNVLKRVIRVAHRFRYESGIVAQGGTREELVDLLGHYLHPDHPASEELKEYVTRTIRAFGASLETED